MRDIFRLSEKPEDRPALLSDEGVMVTYGDLQQRAAEMCKAISERSLIFCMCRNEPGAVVGYLGALGNGLVPLLLDTALQQGQLAHFYEIYQPAYIWASEEWAEREEGHALYVKQKVYEAYGYILWKTGCESCPLYPELGLLLATSGSTGDPRIVRLSYRNLMANAESICEYLQLDQSERPVTTLPMQYTYGLSVINSHLLAGACVLLTTASLVQKEFWDFLEIQKATSFGGVPYTYEILRKIHAFQRRIPSLRTMTQAGGRLPPALQREVAIWARQQGIAFYVMYGQTEATARMAYLPPEQSLEKPGSIGMAIPGGRFCLLDENGKTITGADQIGELVYEGENVSLGYAQCREDLLLGDVRQGVLFTGDLARRDTDGYYYIEGRQKRFVKIFGIRVSLDACEEILREKYPGSDLACDGRDDCLTVYVGRDSVNRLKGSGQIPDGTPENADISVMLTDKLAEILQINRRGFAGVMVEQIPKNAAGKILYGELKRIV
ncbi:MAG: AMP-binding protein [Clostridiales bacterium]|nr:AMP-binding protein [Clostridiales bacterium]